MALPGDEGDRLTELGRRQAREAGRHLGELGATRILTSPLRRARETAEGVAETLGLPVVELEPLHELRESDGFGELELEEQRLRRWSVWMAEHGDDPDHSYRRRRVVQRRDRARGAGARRRSRRPASRTCLRSATASSCASS